MRAKKILTLIVSIAALALGAAMVQSCDSHTSQHPGTTDNHSPSPGATTGKTSTRVPAHYEAPPESAELRAVLPASQFSGKAREAYEAVSKIPTTIAQMPCYCHCDRGMGHKSLHSCFEDDHAAHCAVCVDEALMAYRLEKDGLSAAQIRDRIIAKFGT
ncbi:MAG TPA: CYCXC family (seleno)protein [Pyrinomonadaceae bacterium]|nr:CYCXC family (seleno)protein [Pyrinomonadaceae bacterium]